MIPYWKLRNKKDNWKYDQLYPMYFQIWEF